ncbi:MAG: dephospho-CoA kinase [Cyclobacteriaceae bacterium]|nr:dephospho-CoA kinase [Cyclobacteriaceae bacterium]
MNSPVAVGITGGIGSGKSVVCHIFSLLGVPVYYADVQAKTITETDPTVIKSINSEFGAEAFSEDGTLNRRYLADIAFHNPEKLSRLNKIIHPAVEKDFRSWIKTHYSAPFVIKEAALLLESGSYKNLDFIIVVFSTEGQRISRIMARDKHRTLADIKAIMSRQTDDAAKFAVSHFRIDNTGTKLLIPQVLKIHEFLVNLNQSG